MKFFTNATCSGEGGSLVISGCATGSSVDPLSLMYACGAPSEGLKMPTLAPDCKIIAH
jgi:hypothetical protein